MKGKCWQSACIISFVFTISRRTSVAVVECYLNVLCRHVICTIVAAEQPTSVSVCAFSLSVLGRSEDADICEGIVL